MEPWSHTLALTYPGSDECIAATRAEINSLVQQGVLEACEQDDEPPHIRALQSVVVYKPKTNADGSLDKYKVRVLAHVDTQHPDTHDATFAPVLQLAILRIFIMLCVMFEMEARRFDAAFSTGSSNTISI